MDDKIDLTQAEYAPFLSAIEACVNKHSGEIAAEAYVTGVHHKSTLPSGETKLKLVLCSGMRCDMRSYVVSADNASITEGWPKAAAPVAADANAAASSGLLIDAILETAAGDVVSAASALGGKVVALYFSAHWCPPCRQFTPQLKAAYEEANKDGKQFEVVFVSSDNDAASCASYMSEMHGDWLRLPFDSPLRAAFKTQYGAFAGRERGNFPGVTRRDGIPAMVIVGPDGALQEFVSCEDGSDAISTTGGAAIAGWKKYAWPSSLSGTTLETSVGSRVEAKTALAGKVVALYFSAHWCPPCRQFTPQLKAAYEEANKDGKQFEVVFVSSDNDAASCASYMSEMHGDWLRLPFDSPLRAAFKTQYGAFAGRERGNFPGVTRRDGIPAMVIVGPDGALQEFVSCEDGSDAISTTGGAAIAGWKKYAWP